MLVRKDFFIKNTKNLPPLVVGVDVPDDALGEDLVLVHGDEGAQREGGHLLHHDRVGRPVALENLLGKIGSF